MLKIIFVACLIPASLADSIIIDNQCKKVGDSEACAVLLEMLRGADDCALFSTETRKCELGNPTMSVKSGTVGDKNIQITHKANNTATETVVTFQGTLSANGSTLTAESVWREQSKAKAAKKVKRDFDDMQLMQHVMSQVEPMEWEEDEEFPEEVSVYYEEVEYYGDDTRRRRRDSSNQSLELRDHSESIESYDEKEKEEMDYGKTTNKRDADKARVIVTCQCEPVSASSVEVAAELPSDASPVQPVHVKLPGTAAVTNSGSKLRPAVQHGLAGILSGKEANSVAQILNVHGTATADCPLHYRALTAASLSQIAPSEIRRVAATTQENCHMLCKNEILSQTACTSFAFSPAGTDDCLLLSSSLIPTAADKDKPWTVYEMC